MVTTALAQTSFPLHLESLTINNGLSQVYVSSVVQDKKGFMWFATSEGLNKYDGYTFTVYHHNPDDTASIGSDDLTFVFEDSKERLWIGTRHDGIDLFDREHNVFTHIRHTGKNSLRSNNILSVTEDKEGCLWIRTRQGIDRLEITAGKAPLKPGLARPFYNLRFTPINLDAAFEATNYKYGPAKVFVDSRNSILLTTNSKIWEVAFDAKRHSYNLIQRLTFQALDSGYIAGLIEDTVQRRFFVNNREIWGFDYNFNSAEKVHGRVSAVTTWTIDNQQRLWLLGDSKIVRIGLLGNKTEKLGLEDPVQVKAINTSTACYTDRTGVVWIATGGYGILKYDPERERFHHIFPQQYFYQLLESDDGSIVTNNLQSVTIKKGQPLSSSLLTNAAPLKKKFRVLLFLLQKTKGEITGSALAPLLFNTMAGQKRYNALPCRLQTKQRWYFPFLPTG